MAGRFRVCGYFPILFILLACPLASAQDLVRVPGGTAAVARLLGNVDTDLDKFCASLNRVLLSQIVIGHDWKDHDNRTLLVEYARVVGDLGGAEEVRIVFEGKNKSGLKQFSAFAKKFGYNTKRRKGKLELIPRDDDQDKLRRTTAMALEWDLVGAANRLSDGDQVVFSAASQEVVAPIEFRVWSSLSQRVGDTVLFGLGRSLHSVAGLPRSG